MTKKEDNKIVNIADQRKKRDIGKIKLALENPETRAEAMEKLMGEGHRLGYRVPLVRQGEAIPSAIVIQAEIDGTWIDITPWNLSGLQGSRGSISAEDEAAIRFAIREIKQNDKIIKGSDKVRQALDADDKNLAKYLSANLDFDSDNWITGDTVPVRPEMQRVLGLVMHALRNRPLDWSLVGGIAEPDLDKSA